MCLCVVWVCVCVCVCESPPPPIAGEEAKNSSFNTGMALQKKHAKNQLEFLPFTERRTQAIVKGSLVIGFTVPSTATLSSSDADEGNSLLFLRI